MLRLFNFIYRFRNTFLFILLEGIAIYIILSNNDYQRHVFGDRVLAVSSSVQKQRAQTFGYFKLRGVNKDLEKENLKLHRKLDSLTQRMSRVEQFLMKDSIPITQFDESNDHIYEYIIARVIKNTTNKNYNYIILDKGANDGISIDMGVISSEGIAGRVIKVVDDYSLVLSAINMSFKLSVKTLKQQSVGVFEWKGGSPLSGVFNYLHSPGDEMIEKGDTILTSEYSQIFPPDYMVGLVENVGEQKNNGFYNVRVNFGTDFRKIKYLYVLSDKRKSIVDSLEVNIRNN